MNRSASNSSMLMTMTSTSLRGHASGATGVNQSSTTTANVDIEVPAAIMTGSGGIVDRTFQVGSPPSSSGGSIGSESERIHRALILGGIEQDGLVLNMSDHENRSPEVGSAVSALGASSGGSS